MLRLAERVFATVPTLAACALALALACGPASAHAVLVASDPPADAALANAPAAVTLTFDEPVEPIGLRLVDRATGAPVAELAPTADAVGRVTAPLPPLPEGRWLISWRVISADSHPVSGSIAFDVGDLPPGAGTATDAGPEPLALGAGAARAVFLALLLAAAGGAIASAVLASRLGEPEASRVRRTVAALAVGCALASILFVSAQGALVTGGFDGRIRVSEGLATPLGRATFAAGALALVIALLLSSGARGALGRGAAALAGCAALASIATAGHAATAPPRAVAGLALAAHALAAGLWFGGLVVISTAMRSASNADLAHLLAAFSRRALPAVALLVAAGTGLAALQIRDPSALLATEWGRLLLAKVALVALALALAAQNKTRLTGAIARAESGARRRLACNVRAEIVLVAGVLALTGMLGQTPQPRALAAAVAVSAPVVLAAHDHRHRTAGLALVPLPDGRLGIEAALRDAQGRPIAPREAELAASLPEAGIEPLQRAMRIEGGVARIETADLAAPGLWRLELRLLVDDFDAARVVFEARLP